MTPRIHSLMQYPNNDDSVTRDPEINDMLLNAAAPIAASNPIATRRTLRCFCEIGAGGFDQIGIAQRLGQAPFRHRIIEHTI